MSVRPALAWNLLYRNGRNPTGWRRWAGQKRCSGSEERGLMEQSISTLNKERWSGKLAGHIYRNADALFAPEQVILKRISRKIRGKRILDIGVGTGRTTGSLLSLSPHYTGIDYSRAMVERAQRRHPDVDYRCMDARDLTAFADKTFDLVWFSFNGIDYVSHEDRLRILGEIHRVTKPGGYFCFSSHNREYPELERDLGLRAPEFTPNPVKLAFRTAMHARSIYNAWDLKRREIRTEEYAILNDTELHHGLMTYYISLPAQIAQLDRAGFRDVRAFGLGGETLDLTAACDDGYMVHYLAERA